MKGIEWGGVRQEAGLGSQEDLLGKQKAPWTAGGNRKLRPHTLAEEAETDLCKIQIYIRYSRTVTLPGTANSQHHEANATITPDRCCYCSGQAPQKHGTCCFCGVGGRSEEQKRILNRLHSHFPALASSINWEQRQPWQILQ